MSEVLTRRFEGKNAIVTGASRGIGLAIARRIVEEGGKVCLTARNENALREAVATMPKGSATFVAGKADDTEHRATVMDHAAETLGGLDVLVNNAGINPVYGTMMELDLGAARKLLEVNLVGALGWVQTAFHHESLEFRQRRGSIVNLASTAGFTAAEGIGFYGVTKAALMHLTTTLSTELGPEIRVNAVAPGVVKTDFARALYEGREAEVAAPYPLKRLGAPEDIAAAVAFFACDDAGWVTGQTLVIDGGLLASGGSA